MEENQEVWTLIYTTNRIIEVEIIKNIMSENDIQCVEINKMDSSYLIGDIEVYVKDIDAERAKKLIPVFGEEK